jgi:hypothetical protein
VKLRCRESVVAKAGARAGFHVSAKFSETGQSARLRKHEIRHDQLTLKIGSAAENGA